METKAGTRLQCDTCGSQLIVVKAEGPELECCGQPLAPVAKPGPAAGGQPGS